MNGLIQSRWLAYLRKGLYLILPVVILAFIFSRIDVAEFRHNIAKTDLRLAVFGVVYYPLVILVGAIRWRFVVMKYLQRPLPMGFMLRHYWVGLALGIFAPASVGWDVYRIVVVGRKFGGAARNLAAILAEKVVALLNIVLMIALLYPLVKGHITSDTALVADVVKMALLLLALFSVGAVLLVFARKRHLGQSIQKRGEQFLQAKMKQVSGVLKRPVTVESGSFSYTSLIAPLAKPGPFLTTLFYCLMIQCLAAVGTHIFFKAVGYDVPLLVNLFLSPVFFFIFLLPISFGSLGVREGAYILLYGLFGVPPEIALLVSFLNLSGLLLNNLMGTVLLWGRDKTEA